MAEPDIPVSADTEPTQPIPTSEDELQNDGMIKDTLEGIATGATKGMNEVGKAANTATGGYLAEATDWLGANVADLGSLGVDDKGDLVYYRAATAIQEAKEAGLERGDPAFDDFVSSRVTTTKLTNGLQTVSGNISSALTQFAIGWFPANRMMNTGGKLLGLEKATTRTGKAAKMMGEGAIAETLAFDKYEERLSNIIEDYPFLQQPITGFLAANPNDPAPLAVLKQATEGLLVESVVGSLVAGLKVIRAKKNDIEDTELLIKEAGEAAAKIYQEKDFAGEITNELKSIAESSEILNNYYKASESLTGAARTTKRLEGREAAVEVMTDERLADLQAKGGAIKLTREAIQENAKKDIGRYLTSFGYDASEGITKWEQLHAGDIVQARNTIAQAVELREISNTLFSKSSAKYREAVESGASEQDQKVLRLAMNKDFVNTLKLVNLIQGGFSESGRMLDFAKAVDGWNIQTIGAAMEAGSVFADPNASKHFQGQLVRHGYDIFKAGAKGVRIINELFINSILSGVKTHLVNIGSNTFTTATMPIERLGGAAIRGDKVEMMKALRTYAGYRHYAWDSFKASVHAARKGQTVLDVDRSILEEGVQNGEIPWLLGKLIRMPTRLLAAEDEFFKQMNFRAHAYAESMADGTALGYRGDKLAAYANGEVEQAVKDMIESNISGVLTNPLSQKSIIPAREVTQTQDVAGTSVNEMLSESYTKLVNKAPILRQISPFIRTPLNLASYTLQRSPLAPLSGRWRRDMRQGGQAEAQAIVRWGVGMGLADYFYSLAQDGSLTGTGAGLSIDQVKAMEDMYGYKRNAVYDGKQYLEVSRLSPATDLMTIMASIYELNKYGATEEADDLALSVAVVLSDFARDKTFMQGVNDFLNAVEDPERYFTSYLGSKAAAMVPYSGLLKSLNGDPKLRKIYEIAEGYKKTIPGLSKDLDPVRNILGEQKLIPEFWGIDFASPIGLSIEKDDPIALAFKQAADAGTPFNIGLPSSNDNVDWTNRAFSTDFNGEPLNPKRVGQTAYDRWIEVSGSMSMPVFGVGTQPLNLREALTKVIEDPKFNEVATANYTLNGKVYQGKQSDIIKTLIKEYRKVAKEKMIGANPYETNSNSGVFGSDGFLLEVKGALNPKLAVAYWTEYKIANEFVKSQEGQQFLKSNEKTATERLNGIFSQGSN